MTGTVPLSVRGHRTGRQAGGGNRLDVRTERGAPGRANGAALGLACVGAVRGEIANLVRIAETRVCPWGCPVVPVCLLELAACCCIRV